MGKTVYPVVIFKKAENIHMHYAYSPDFDIEVKGRSVPKVLQNITTAVQEELDSYVNQKMTIPFPTDIRELYESNRKDLLSFVMIDFDLVKYNDNFDEDYIDNEENNNDSENKEVVIEETNIIKDESDIKEDK